MVFMNNVLEVSRKMLEHIANGDTDSANRRSANGEVSHKMIEHIENASGDVQESPIRLASRALESTRVTVQKEQTAVWEEIQRCGAHLDSKMLEHKDFGTKRRSSRQLSIQLASRALESTRITVQKEHTPVLWRQTPSRRCWARC